MHSVYDNILSKIGIRPQSITVAVNGMGIDTMGFDSAMVTLEVGAVSGAPTSFTVDLKLQESDNNTTWNDVIGTVIPTITVPNVSAQMRIDGLSTTRKRYLRVVATPVFNAGMSPSIQISAHVMLGQAYNAPVANSPIGV
jgi:hypothetical protein